MKCNVPSDFRPAEVAREYLGRAGSAELGHLLAHSEDLRRNPLPGFFIRCTSYRQARSHPDNFSISTCFIPEGPFGDALVSSDLRRVSLFPKSPGNYSREMEMGPGTDNVVSVSPSKDGKIIFCNRKTSRGWFGSKLSILTVGAEGLAYRHTDLQTRPEDDIGRYVTRDSRFFLTDWEGNLVLYDCPPDGKPKELYYTHPDYLHHVDPSSRGGCSPLLAAGSTRGRDLKNALSYAVLKEECPDHPLHVLQVLVDPGVESCKTLLEFSWFEIFDVVPTPEGDTFFVLCLGAKDFGNFLSGSPTPLVGGASWCTRRQRRDETHSLGVYEISFLVGSLVPFGAPRFYVPGKHLVERRRWRDYESRANASFLAFSDSPGRVLLFSRESRSFNPPLEIIHGKEGEAPKTFSIDSNLSAFCVGGQGLTIFKPCEPEGEEEGEKKCPRDSSFCSRCLYPWGTASGSPPEELTGRADTTSTRRNGSLYPPSKPLW